ncbi:Serine/threonine-protein phosphatase 2A regulatory subunit B'' subunit alpha [Coemansia sp. RSA 990]|nr:Serine/threonine-protein phosphatase 2A regulatory subunit B'' subunit alpha [Coemansia sp. RSA 990]
MGLATEDPAPMATPQKKNGAAAAAGTGISSPILQADELSLNPRWSPHLKSPRPASTISSRLRQQSLAAEDDAQAADLFQLQGQIGEGSISGSIDAYGRGLGGMGSPLSKRARILQTGSPESLPPLSPVVSNRRRALRADAGPEAALPFSPTASGLRIRCSPSSPLSPTLRTTPNRAEPESPTLTRMLARDSPSLALDEKLGGLEDESPTVSQMSRSLLFRLDLESPTARRAGSAELGHSPLAGLEKSTRMAPAMHRRSPRESSDEEPPSAGEVAGVLLQRKPSTLQRRSSAMQRSSATAESKRRRMAASRACGVPQIFVSPQTPRLDREFDWAVKQQLALVRKHFESSFGARESDFAKVTVDCGLPRYANRALFRYATRDAGDVPAASGSAIIGKRTRHTDREAWPSFEHFSRVWLRLRRSSSDTHALLFNILVDDATRPRPYLTRDDFRVVISDVFDHHYELEFLEGQGPFLQSYAETVIERIFYMASRPWDGKLQLSQFRKADVVGMLSSLEVGIDLNVESPGPFSYKHFYVIFCSFFELDTNQDNLLDARDLLRYFNGTLSRRVISRIMMGKGKPSEHTVRRSPNDPKAKARAEKRKARGSTRYDLNVSLSDCRMTFHDFIWFLQSEIDKTSPTAIEYWFRCLDLDGDGILSVYELEYFYDEQLCRMEKDMTSDIITLDDLMCQLSDMVRPEREGLITLKDLRRTPPALVPVFFDAFMNLTRFIEHETRTSFMQRHLAQLSMRALPNTSFQDVIQMRMDFLASVPNPWIEFTELEYTALLEDHQQNGQDPEKAPADVAQAEAAAPNIATA